jgi:hypothetical protein
VAFQDSFLLLLPSRNIGVGTLLPFPLPLFSWTGTCATELLFGNGGERRREIRVASWVDVMRGVRNVSGVEWLGNFGVKYSLSGCFAGRVVRTWSKQAQERLEELKLPLKHCSSSSL